MAGRKSTSPRQPLSVVRPKAVSTKRQTAPNIAPRKAAAATQRVARTSPPAAKQKSVNHASRRPKTAEALRAYAAELYRRLTALYPDAHCELDFHSPFELLVATILSAQCTDKRVNMTTPELFARFPNAPSLAAAPQEEVESIIKSTGFFRAKAKSLLGMSNALVERHRGEVPSSMPELVVLPGVGRKTANVVLGNAFDINVGVVVDTHVGRLAIRLGLTRETDPTKVEQVLMKLFPSPQWTMLSHLLIWHGRRVCDAKKPRCAECALSDICPSSLVP